MLLKAANYLDLKIPGKMKYILTVGYYGDIIGILYEKSIRYADMGIKN